MSSPSFPTAALKQVHGFRTAVCQKMHFCVRDASSERSGKLLRKLVAEDLEKYIVQKTWLQ